MRLQKFCQHIKLFAVDKLFVAFAQVHKMQKSYLIPSKLLIKCEANFHQNMSVKKLLL